MNANTPSATQGAFPRGMACPGPPGPAMHDLVSSKASMWAQFALARPVVLWAGGTATAGHVPCLPGSRSTELLLVATSARSVSTGVVVHTRRHTFVVASTVVLPSAAETTILDDDPVGVFHTDGPRPSLSSHARHPSATSRHPRSMVSE